MTEIRQIGWRQTRISGDGGNEPEAARAFRFPRKLSRVALDPDTADLIDGFARDMRGIGHWGTGNLEIMVSDAADLERAKPLLQRSYLDS